jgi:penicillin-binding protein 1C
MQELAAREAGTAGAGAEIAALIIRNSDRAVIGYLGGSNSGGHGGMVDMVRATRSPGSVLKPFIYGIAMDDGLIRPDTLIEDTKMRIADYAPEDFDRAFRGTVSAAEALQQSYNLPAVTLLDWLGPGRFAAAIRGAGAHIVIPGNGQATLPLALGGVGMNLWDLSALYAGLADGGEVRPLLLLPGDPAGSGAALLTKKAAADIVAILRDTPRPAGFSAFSRRRIAYKTGTSFGFRDAWAFGLSRKVTVGVWVGHPDGTTQPGAFGRTTAAPLLFRLFDLLPEEGDDFVEEPSRDSDCRCARAPSMRRLPARDAHLLQTEFPHILYPPAGVVLELPPGGALSLEAAGGFPPYRWAVNGVPLPAPKPDDPASWQPDGPGFAHVTLTDSLDHVVEEVVRLQ